MSASILNGYVNENGKRAYVMIYDTYQSASIKHPDKLKTTIHYLIIK